MELPAGKPDDLIQLGQNILNGLKTNPIPALDNEKLRKLVAVVETAANNNNLAKSLDAQGQTARQKRDNGLGIGKGQTASSPDTLLNLVMYIRDQLLLVNEGNEDVLEQYGFDVVISTAKSPVRAQKAVTATT